MDRLLARLERRFGRFAIPHVATYIAGLFALVFVLGMTKPLFLYNLLLIPQLVLKGQVWRLFTWVFIPPPTSPIWVIFLVLFYWTMGQALEEAWGKFKLNVFYLIGIVATVVASLASGYPMSSYFLHMSVFLAFGTMFPDYQVLIFFIIPVRVKWLALIDGATMLYFLATGGWDTRFAVIAALVNYLLFFGPHLVGLVRGYGVQTRQATRRGELERPARDTRPKRACKICGKTDEDEGADLRVCTCQEVCGGKPTVYCLEHARSHNKH